ncbi:MAG: hypothetical protein SGCHY_005109, partial [Lobulomycetales sp.]
ETGLALVFPRFDADALSLVNPARPLSMAQRRDIIRQIASALAYLHDECGIVHRDVKLENILVRFTTTTTSDCNSISSSNNSNSNSPCDPRTATTPPSTPEPTPTHLPTAARIHAVLADFGLSHRVSDPAPLKRGSPAYLSPETFLATTATPTDTRAVDCFALGVVMYALYMHAMPFPGGDRREMWSAIALGRWTRPRPDQLGGREALDVLEGLLARRPGDRWTAARVLRSPWLASSADCL